MIITNVCIFCNQSLTKDADSPAHYLVMTCKNHGSCNSINYILYREEINLEFSLKYVVIRLNHDTNPYMAYATISTNAQSGKTILNIFHTGNIKKYNLPNFYIITHSLQSILGKIQKYILFS